MEWLAGKLRLFYRIPYFFVLPYEETDSKMT